MINPTETIRITTTSYLLQFVWYTCEYHNYDVYATTVYLKDMYLAKYSKDYYGSTLHSFKAVVMP